MTQTPDTLFDALVAASLGQGISPDACEQLIARELAKWVDYEFGTPIHHDDPRSWLAITASGRSELATLDVFARKTGAVLS